MIILTYGIKKIHFLLLQIEKKKENMRKKIIDYLIDYACPIISDNRLWNFSDCTSLFMKDWNTAYVSVRNNAAPPQNNVPSESSFAIKSAQPNRRKAPQGESAGGGYPLPQVGVWGASPGKIFEKWTQMVHSEPIFCRVRVDFFQKTCV